MGRQQADRIIGSRGFGRVAAPADDLFEDDYCHTDDEDMLLRRRDVAAPAGFDLQQSPRIRYSVSSAAPPSGERMSGVMHAAQGAHMSLFCCICGSGSPWESWWVAAEGEHCEGYERFRSVEAESDSGEEPDLGVGGFDQSL